MSPFAPTILFVGLLASTSLGGSVIEAPKKTGTAVDGAVTFGYQGSEELHTGYADLLQPLFSSGDHVRLFYDGRFAFDDSDQEVQSHGLVFRYRVPDRDIIFGANAYYDSVDSAHGYHFDQLGLGVELLTKWVDFRANYYLPDQKRERIDQRHEVVTSIHREVRGGREFVSGAFQRRELTQFESPLEGLNTELGFRVPGIDRYAEVRVFGGYYHYLNPYGSDYDGLSARLEARIRRGITAEVQYWDDPALTGGHWTGGVRVSLPFNLGNIFAGRNPFEGASEAFGPPSGDFGDRMTDFVVRSHRVKTTTSGFVQTGIQNATSVSVKNEGGRIVVTPSFSGESSSPVGVTITGPGSIVLSGPNQGAGTTLSGGTLQLSSGAISSPGGITKTGSGTLVLSGPNQWTGSTVFGGTLLINNSTSIPSPPVTVGSSGGATNVVGSTGVGLPITGGSLHLNLPITITSPP